MIQRIIIQNYKGIKSADITFNESTNIIVGNNGVGKSTLIEAMSLALGYGLNKLEITPNLFHLSTWKKFQETKELPTILIEVFFEPSPELAEFSGTNLSLHSGEYTGIRFSIEFDEDYRELFEIGKNDCKYIPCEYYKIERYWFSGNIVKQYYVPYHIQLIDSTSAYFNSRTNQYLGQMIQSKLSKEENIQIKNKLRKIKENFEEDSDVKNINQSLSDRTQKIKKNFSISVDLNSKMAWNTIMCPVLDDIPFNQIGLGDQCIVKTLLSIDDKESEKESIVIIEEPESHLSHTKMYELLEYLSTRAKGQLFVTTHSSYVANRLEIENLILMTSANGVITTRKIDRENSKVDVYKYFFKTCNYPTLRFILCKKAILVEGPTDEMIINYFYKTKYRRHPFADGIELIAVGGIAFKYFIDLAISLQIKVAVITDNDSHPEEYIKALYNPDNLENIGVFTESNILLHSLEPSFVRKNLDFFKDLSDVLRKIKEENDSEKALVKFMENNKAEWAYRLLSSLDIVNCHIFNVPDYIESAINWIKN